MNKILHFFKKLLSWKQTNENVPSQKVEHQTKSIELSSQTSITEKIENAPSHDLSNQVSDEGLSITIQEQSKLEKPNIMAGDKAGTLYALCIGINDYQYVPKLGGCVPDATNVYNYLKDSCANTDFEFNAVTLFNEQATKANIVKNFQEHLGQAKEGDIAVFYFSGHGAEEEADEVWHSSSQKTTIGTIVCYDSRSPEGVTDIADKELRYLINKISYREDGSGVPHFVLMTDSCHSGGATKNVGEMTPRLTQKGSPRTWDKFIFSDKFSREDFLGKPLKKVLPQGQHIHFSSCEGSELAYEVRGSGVFTGTMLEVLKRTSGKITYNDLHNRIRYFIKGRFPQTPTIHSVSGEAVDGMKMYFLGGASEQKGITANVVFNTKLRKWILDMGAIQGIPTSGYDSVEVNLLDNDSNVLVQAVINQVSPDSCYLTLDEDKVDIQDSYTAEIKGMYRDPVGVFLDMDSDTGSMAKLKAEFDKVDDLAGSHNLQLTDTFAGADYVVSVNKGHYEISRQSDEQKRPIVEQQDVNDGKVTETVLEFMKYIARYDFTWTLENPKTRLAAGDSSKPAAGIEVYLVHDENDRSQDELLPINENNEVIINEGDLISIKTINNTRRNTLFFALVSDSTNDELEGVYGIHATSLGASAQEMLPGEDLWLFEMAEFDVYHADHILDFGFPETRMKFKLIASTETFSPRELNHDPLPYPYKYDKPDKKDPRGLKRRSRPDGADWCTYDLDIVLKNPNGK